MEAWHRVAWGMLYGIYEACHLRACLYPIYGGGAHSHMVAYQLYRIYGELVAWGTLEAHGGHMVGTWEGRLRHAREHDL